MANVSKQPTTIGQAGEVRLARIESLRAIAALGVLLGHAWLFGRVAAGDPAGISDTYLHRIILSGGFGLSLFFGLTGYLLYWPFANRDFGNGGRVDVATYARNRAFRILPLYYVVLVVLMILQQHGGTAGQWGRFLLFAQNFSSGTVGTVDGPMWSLVVEVHFYILLPLLALVIARVARGRLAVGALALAVPIALSLALHWVKVAHPSSAVDLRWEYSLPTQFLFLGAGMAVALLRTRWRETLPPLLRGPLGSTDLWIVAAAVLYLVAAYDYKYAALTGVASALVIGACVLPLHHGPLVRLLDWRPLAVVGVASYSLYLWHFPLQDKLADTFDGPASLLVVSAIVAIAIALVSYRVVEEPFLRLRRRWSASAAAQVEDAPAAVATATPPA